MSAFVWIDESRKEALKFVIGCMGPHELIQPLQDMLDEVQKSEDFKIQDMFTIKEV